MDDFLFENKFCQHLKYLQENSEVFVSFNIDRYHSILNDKIIISLYYNNKLDVENERSRLDKFAVKCKLNERSWQFPAKLPLAFLIFTMEAFYSTLNLLTLLTLSIDNR